MASSIGLMAPQLSHRTQTLRFRLRWIRFSTLIGMLERLGSFPVVLVVGKAVNPSNSKAGRLVEKAQVSKLSHVIFTSAFGMWMERKRREIAWKWRDKVDSKKNRTSRLSVSRLRARLAKLNWVFAVVQGFRNGKFVLKNRILIIGWYKMATMLTAATN